MRVLVAFDKFKGSLSAPQACDSAAQALRQLHPGWQCDLCPLTDGGDGFTAILTQAAGGRRLPFRVTGPRGGLVDASVGLVAGHRISPEVRRLLQLPESATPTIAIIEMATASGLDLLAPEEYDPWQATSHGTGQLIRAAAEAGAGAILLGVGGSATNDLGLGALDALGVEFRGVRGGLIRPPAPASWQRIAHIGGEVFPAIPPICIACDVTNPLLGSRGAAAVYGPQKGLRAGDLARLEQAMVRMAGLLCAHCGQPANLADTPGAGAAGGLPFGLMAAARARLIPGVELVAAWLDLGARIAAADLILTGEGRFDESSLSGKGPGAMTAAAASLGKKVHVFAGVVAVAVPPPGCQLHAITPREYSLEQAGRDAAHLLAQSVRAAF